jgi:uncharacterized protein (DUF1501 family)
MNTTGMSRRRLLHVGASFGVLSALGKVGLAQTAPTDYKALVCLFMFGGNDAHNLVVPLDSTQFAAYTAARGTMALPASQLLPVTDPALGSMGLHYGMPEMQTLFGQGRMAIVSNVGMLVQPTSYGNFGTPGFPLPTNLRSHSDQVVQMQTGIPSSGGGTGWGGRTIDTMQTAYGYNAGSSFPAAISIQSPALFCNAATTQSVALQPGNVLGQSFLNIYPASAAQARANAQNAMLAADTGITLANSANRVMRDAIALNPLLAAAASSVTFTTAFPSTPIGQQLREIARVISLNSQVGVGRQVFFASLGGFDTHSGQPWQQWNLLSQVSQALNAFYAATVQLGVSDRVTAFTLSDFGRTLQPSGSGTDHGWGSHHMVLGGAVNGGRIHGRFPLMTNYGNFNSTADDYADARGTLLPQISLAQYGATLARWFGATDAARLDTLFPTLPNFGSRDVGFLA